MNVIERAKAEAERRWPLTSESLSDRVEASGYVSGATFAATITPEQIEDGARALYHHHHGWNDPEGAWRRAEDRVKVYYRTEVCVAFRAAGFIIEGEES